MELNKAITTGIFNDQLHIAKMPWFISLNELFIVIQVWSYCYILQGLMFHAELYVDRAGVKGIFEKKKEKKKR